MKRSFLILSLLVAGCAGQHIENLPPEPGVDRVINNDVPVPVLCKAEVERIKSAIDTAERGMPLEQQNAMLRQTIAEQKAYIKALEAGIIGCGGKIRD